MTAQVYNDWYPNPTYKEGGKMKSTSVRISIIDAIYFINRREAFRHVVSKSYKFPFLLLFCLSPAARTGGDNTETVGMHFNDILSIKT